MKKMGCAQCGGTMKKGGTAKKPKLGSGFIVTGKQIGRAHV